MKKRGILLPVNLRKSFVKGYDDCPLKRETEKEHSLLFHERLKRYCQHSRTSSRVSYNRKLGIFHCNISDVMSGGNEVDYSGVNFMR
jgi:hypothetical protein